MSGCVLCRHPSPFDDLAPVIAQQWRAATERARSESKCIRVHQQHQPFHGTTLDVDGGAWGVLGVRFFGTVGRSGLLHLVSAKWAGNVYFSSLASQVAESA